MKKTVNIKLFLLIFVIIITAASSFFIGSIKDCSMERLLFIAGNSIVKLLHQGKLIKFDEFSFQSMVPTKENLEPDPRDDQEYLRTVVSDIFPEDSAGKHDDEEKAIEILRFVALKLLLKNNTGNAVKILKQGYAICGGRVVVFEALANQVGIPTRKVNIFGIVGQGGHSLIEAYWGQKWHVLDPSFGVFFYSRTSYDKQGEIASLKELIDSSGDGFYIFRVVEKPWTGKYIPINYASYVVRAENDYLSDVYGRSLPDLYEEYVQKGFPIEYGYEKQILSYPLILDFTIRNEVHIGIIDKDFMDVALLTAQPAYAGRVATYYITPTRFHSIFTITPSTGIVKIVYYSPYQYPDKIRCFPLKAAHVIDNYQQDDKAVFIIRVSDTNSAFQFFVDSGVFWVDSIQAFWMHGSKE